MSKRLLLALIAFGVSAVGEENRLYRFLIEQNKAQIVALDEGKLIPRALAKKLARALGEIDERNRKSGKLSANYLDLEEQLVQSIGPEASNVHMGRSRNDLGATSERMILREDTLAILGRLAEARQAAIALAEKNVRTVIPGFTHSVQAQPTTLAHSLSAYISALERDEARLRETYARLDRCPLGAAAFTTSGFALDRRRLAELMGFSGLLENGYDAIMVSTADSKAELASALALSAINVGRFAQQFAIQYSDSRPGLNLADETVGHSSIMPQKRNPRQAERIRILASAVVGDAHTVALTAHNTPGGEIADIRVHLVERTEVVTRAAEEMFSTLAGFVRAIRVDPKRTLELVDADYSVMTEFADTLLRESQVPFRTGHKVASELAAYGRANGKRPADLTFEEVTEVYRKAAGGPIPLTAERVKEAMSATHFIESRRGIGGPQPAEMERMLAGHRARVAGLEAWLGEERARLRAADEARNRAFARLTMAASQ
ncbi:MAG: argininosuccinate lyase [Bryobacteraceae bacterium]|nr:argininosuccinate lyase [Bryobacteraceae bacterium]